MASANRFGEWDFRAILRPVVKVVPLVEVVDSVATVVVTAGLLAADGVASIGVVV